MPWVFREKAGALARWRGIWNTLGTRRFRTANQGTQPGRTKVPGRHRLTSRLCIRGAPYKRPSQRWLGLFFISAPFLETTEVIARPILRLSGKVAQGVGRAHTAILDKEIPSIAVRPAAEAMIELFDVGHGKRWTPLGVERAQCDPLHFGLQFRCRAPFPLHQRDKVVDDILDTNRGKHDVYILSVLPLRQSGFHPFAHRGLLS